MRIYQNCREMHSEEKRNLHEMGTIVHPATMQDKQVADDPAYRTLELSPATFTILDGISDMNDWLTELGLSVTWAQAELRERLSGYEHGHGVNPGEAWRLREAVWREFIHDGRFAYTYSERFAQSVAGSDWETGETAIERVARELRERPDTRQAVLPVFTVMDLRHAGGAARLPCSLQYQFLRRGDTLKLLYTMRSSDFMTHFPYDIWQALALQAWMADEIDVKRGSFTFFTGSLHIYAKDADPGVF